MKILGILLLALALSAAAWSAPPSIGTVTNAASFSLAPLPNSAIAVGSFFSIFGTGLGPTTAGFWKPYPLPTLLDGVMVSVTTTGEPVNAYIYFVLDTQINAVMPSTVAPGSGQITVTYNGATSAPLSITVVASSYATFSASASGVGPGIFFNINSKTGVPSLNTFQNTATPGQYITTYGTGLGAPADVADEATAPPQFPDDFTKAPHNLSIDVWVGGKPAGITYAGRSQYTALDQINFIVPAGLQGCHLQVVIQVTPPGGTAVISNFTSLAVDPNGAPCQDGDGVSLYSLTPILASKGSVNVGVIGLESFNLLDVEGFSQANNGSQDEYTVDTVNAEFGTFPASMLDTFQGFAPAPAVNDCSVTPYYYFATGVAPPLVAQKYLNAGASLQVKGPMESAAVPANMTSPGYYGLVGGASWLSESACFPCMNDTQSFFLDQTLNSDGTGTYTTTSIPDGTYTVTGPGGGDVGPLTASVAVSAAASSFQWTNQAVVFNSYSPVNSGPGANPISRDQSLLLTWSGGDPQGYVEILLLSFTGSTAPPNGSAPSLVAQCTAQGGAGAFSVPAYVMQSLVPSSSELPSWGTLISIGPASGVQRVNPAPSGLDALYIYYSFVQSAVAWIQ